MEPALTRADVEATYPRTWEIVFKALDRWTDSWPWDKLRFAVVDGVIHAMFQEYGSWRSIYQTGLGPDVMKVGDIIREWRGGDWALWRVESMFGEDSPYVSGILVSNSKYHKAGMEKRLLEREKYKVETDPHGWALGKFSSLELDAPLHPNASWK